MTTRVIEKAIMQNYICISVDYCNLVNEDGRRIYHINENYKSIL